MKPDTTLKINVLETADTRMKISQALLKAIVDMEDTKKKRKRN
jgi:hypothetical protein